MNHHSECVTVMSCVIIMILNNRHPKNIHNTYVFIIFAHLNNGVFAKCTANFPYCDLSALLYEIITWIIHRYCDILDNQDMLQTNIEI